MIKWKQALALVLAVVMALSLVALPSFAADGDSTGTGTAATGGSTNTPGLELQKAYDPSTGLLTLEAYATGSTTTTTSTEPVDIILVLDVSGSMEDSIVSYTYTPVYEINKNGTTVLLIEQNANMALKAANDAYVLGTGSITLSGTGAELLANEQVRKAYLGS